MPPVDAPTLDVEPAIKETKPPEETFASRDDWLAAAGKLKEEALHVEGIGRLLLSEISGAARAAIVSNQSAGLLADAKRIDAVAYQRALLTAGVVDPSSPKDARVPLFGRGDIDRVMGIGGAKIAVIVDKIEELSALGNYQGRAEENSSGSPSDAGTSG